MNNTLHLIKKGFESSCGKTPEFVSFCKTFKREFNAELKKIEAENVKYSYGHFYISGFFTLNGKAYYFSISDVRHFPENKMLIRTAKDYKDYTGGSNNWFEIKKGMFNQNMFPLF